ncbi:MAG: ATP-binding protein [Candidatus Binatia bacterium]
MLRGYAVRLAGDEGAAVHHAWLFAGPAGVGKFRVARWWASLLKCTDGGACEPACENCRLVAGGVHPDVFETGPAPKDKNATQTADVEIERKKSVGIAESRALLQRLALKPTRPGPRVAIVREAGTMTPEAQNALLKMLEEPPGSAVIVLVTDNVGSMLTTVRSRCRHLAFGALSEDEIVEVLTRLGKESGEARAAAACARGSALRALTFDTEGLADREGLLLAWEEVRRDPAGAEALVQAMVARKDSGYALTDILEWQVAKVEARLGRRGHEPSGELAQVLDETVTTEVRTLVEEATRIQQAIDMIARNANARLVIRDLLMNVRA